MIKQYKTVRVAKALCIEDAMGFSNILNTQSEDGWHLVTTYQTDYPTDKHWMHVVLVKEI